MKEPIENKELNRIDERAIEALAVAPVIRTVSQRIGREEVLAILQEVNQQEAFQRGQSMIEEQQQNGIVELANEVALHMMPCIIVLRLTLSDQPSRAASLSEFLLQVLFHGLHFQSAELEAPIFKGKFKVSAC